MNTSEIFGEIDEANKEFVQLTSSLNSQQVNRVPFKDSWTAAQLVVHVTKSNTSIVKALNAESKIVERKPDERLQQLEKMFLDFSVKLNSPAFILPTENTYSKETTVADLEKSVEELKQAGNKTNLSEAVKHPAFGEITKLELLHFVKYHMQRHLHQLKKIVQVLQNG